jgi:hypothetical protein
MQFPNFRYGFIECTTSSIYGQKFVCAQWIDGYNIRLNQMCVFLEWTTILPKECDFVESPLFSMIITFEAYLFIDE